MHAAGSFRFKEIYVSKQMLLLHYFLVDSFLTDSYLPFVSSASGVQYPNATLGSLTCLRSSVDPTTVFIFTCFFVYAVNPSIPKMKNMEKRDTEISFQVWLKWYSFIINEGHLNSFCETM